MMKALTIASIFALGVVGTACSQTSETTEQDAKVETAATESQTADAATEVGGSFNLGLPAESPSTEVGGSFNLGVPASAPASTDGFNLATDVSASNGLSDIPEIAAPSVTEETEAPDEDDEPVIRLE